MNETKKEDEVLDPSGNKDKLIDNIAKSDDLDSLVNLDKDVFKGSFVYEDGMDELSNSLAEQVSQTVTESATSEEIIEEQEVDNVKAEAEVAKKNSHYIRSKLIKYSCIVLGTIVIIGLFLAFTKPGQYLVFKIAANYMTGKMNYDDGSMDIIGEEIDEVEEIIPDITQLKEEEIDLNADEGLLRAEDYVTNILLLGEESIESDGARGRTDLIMIATMNEKEKTMKLTSLMRDTYVQIPGYRDNKINSAYALGGIELLYETIELNFDIQMDGYVLVGFDEFERIIDSLEGIDITLTKTEANWLNTSNYITEVSNRKMVEGLNHMNGDQALGYCRIRQVGTGNKEYDDFGRTSRQRTVLNAIISKYKEKNLIDLMLIVNKLLPMVTTDITSNELTTYLEKAYNIGLTEIQSFRIPANGTYRSTYVREMSVLIPNLSENVRLLHDFIFGEVNN